MICNYINFTYFLRKSKIKTSFNCLHERSNINKTYYLVQCKRNTGSSKGTNNEKTSSDIDHISVLRKLTTYIWPATNGSDNLFIKSRVCASLALLVASKSINIYVPFIFKNLVDQLQMSGILWSTIKQYDSIYDTECRISTKIYYLHILYNVYFKNAGNELIT